MKTLTVTLGALAVAATMTTTANAHHSGYKTYAACGWYAISACSKSYSSAKHATYKYGGYVINTSNAKYPNFRGGWYCAVRGAFSKHKARRVKRKMRHHGAYSAYIKNAC